MSTTAPVIWITLPVAVVVAVAMLVSASWSERAWAPDAISIISRVMFAWRTLL